MLSRKQKELANDFVDKNKNVGVNWVDFVDGEVEVHFKDSRSNPFTAKEFKVGSTMRRLIESLENKMKWCEDSELE